VGTGYDMVPSVDLRPADRGGAEYRRAYSDRYAIYADIAMLENNRLTRVLELGGSGVRDMRNSSTVVFIREEEFTSVSSKMELQRFALKGEVSALANRNCYQLIH